MIDTFSKALKTSLTDYKNRSSETFSYQILLQQIQDWNILGKGVLYIYRG